MKSKMESAKKGAYKNGLWNFLHKIVKMYVLKLSEIDDYFD